MKQVSGGKCVNFFVQWAPYICNPQNMFEVPAARTALPMNFHWHDQHETLKVDCMYVTSHGQNKQKTRSGIYSSTQL